MDETFFNIDEVLNNDKSVDDTNSSTTDSNENNENTDDEDEEEYEDDEEEYDDDEEEEEDDDEEEEDKDTKSNYSGSFTSARSPKIGETNEPISPIKEIDETTQPIPEHLNGPSLPENIEDLERVSIIAPRFDHDIIIEYNKIRALDNYVSNIANSIPNIDVSYKTFLDVSNLSNDPKSIINSSIIHDKNDENTRNENIKRQQRQRKQQNESDTSMLWDPPKSPPQLKASINELWNNPNNISSPSLLDDENDGDILWNSASKISKSNVAQIVKKKKNKSIMSPIFLPSSNKKQKRANVNTDESTEIPFSKSEASLLFFDFTTFFNFISVIHYDLFDKSYVIKSIYRKGHHENGYELFQILNDYEIPTKQFVMRCSSAFKVWASNYDPSFSQNAIHFGNDENVYIGERPSNRFQHKDQSNLPGRVLGSMYHAGMENYDGDDKKKPDSVIDSIWEEVISTFRYVMILDSIVNKELNVNVNPFAFAGNLDALVKSNRDKIYVIDYKRSYDSYKFAMGCPKLTDYGRFSGIFYDTFEEFYRVPAFFNVRKSVGVYIIQAALYYVLLKQVHGDDYSENLSHEILLIINNPKRNNPNKVEIIVLVVDLTATLKFQINRDEYVEMSSIGVACQIIRNQIQTTLGNLGRLKENMTAEDISRIYDGIRHKAKALADNYYNQFKSV